MLSSPSDRRRADTNLTDKRCSSRWQSLDAGFLSDCLQGAKQYDCIAGYFSSSMLEIAGEALESIDGNIRVICNSAWSRAYVKPGSHGEHLTSLRSITGHAGECLGQRGSWSNRGREKDNRAVPDEHPFALRYDDDKRVVWETCTRVLADDAKRRHLVYGRKDP